METEDTTPPAITGLPSTQMSESDILKAQVVAEDPESGIRSLDITFDGKKLSMEMRFHSKDLRDRIRLSQQL